MKSTFIIALAALLMATGCNRPNKPQTESRNKTEDSRNKSSASPVIQLSSAGFRQHVMDIDNNPGAWKTTDEKPQAMVIDFFATWCGPCSQLAPLMEKAAQRQAGKIRFYKVDIDECPDLADHFAIEHIPAIYFVTADGKASTRIGYMDEEELDEAVRTLTE